jgi:hypothetical protein
MQGFMPPKLFVFNPTCEMAVVNGHASYRPPVRLRQFENELAAIPLWLGGENDYVLVEEAFSDEFTAQLRNWGVSAPQFITYEKVVGHTPPMELHPWGWSPAIHHQFKGLGVEGVSHPMLPWQATHRKLLSRYTGLEVAMAVSECLNQDGTLSIPQLPLVLTSPESIALLEAGMTSPILLKTPWSASGRGLFKIRSRQENAAKNPWVLGKLKQHGALMAEPWLEKLQDLSFHFWVEEEGIQFMGTTYFNTDKDGQFLGCYTAPPRLGFVEDEVLRTMVDQSADLLLRALKHLGLGQRYRGPVGIDGLLFKTQEGKVKLQPCIEVNLRYTMGLVNLFIANHIHPESVGYWNIQRITSVAWQQVQANNPPRLKDGSWYKGVFMLTPPPKESGFMAMLNLTSPV